MKGATLPLARLDLGGFDENDEILLLKLDMALQFGTRVLLVVSLSESMHLPTDEALCVVILQSDVDDEVTGNCVGVGVGGGCCCCCCGGGGCSGRCSCKDGTLADTGTPVIGGKVDAFVRDCV